MYSYEALLTFLFFILITYSFLELSESYSQSIESIEQKTIEYYQAEDIWRCIYLYSKGDSFKIKNAIKQIEEKGVCVSIQSYYQKECRGIALVKHINGKTVKVVIGYGS